jgi:light-harvesting complex I chlorophyll a/b binding protein 1
MAFTMKTLNQRAVANRASRSNTVRVQAVGKTVTERKTVGSKQANPSQRVDDVINYLETLPGWGLDSGPFKTVWDPANLTSSAQIRDVRRWRESELTHGRVAMLAAVGFIVGEQLEDYPMFFNFDGHVQGQAIHQFDQIGQGFWEPLLIAIGLCECYRVSVGWATPVQDGFNYLRPDEEYQMGNLGFDPLGLKPEDPQELRELQNKELNNGRLAMLAIAGFVLQEVAEPGVEIFEHLFYNTQKEVALELNDVEKAVGAPETFQVPAFKGVNKP